MATKLNVTKIVLTPRGGQDVTLTIDEARDLYNQLAELFAPKLAPQAPIVIEREVLPHPWWPYERHLRRLLAVLSGIPLLYLDDGEASGTEHGITIDFMRESPADLDAKLRALMVARTICTGEHTESKGPMAATRGAQDGARVQEQRCAPRGRRAEMTDDATPSEVGSNEEGLGALPEPDVTTLSDYFDASGQRHSMAYSIDAVRKLLAVERERCAKLCEEIGDGHPEWTSSVGAVCAREIRRA